MSPVTHATPGSSKPATRHASQSASISTSSSVKATISPRATAAPRLRAWDRPARGSAAYRRPAAAGKGQVEGLPHARRGRPVVDDDDLEAGIGLGQGVAERVVQAAARAPAGRDHDGGQRRDRPAQRQPPRARLRRLGRPIAGRPARRRVSVSGTGRPSCRQWSRIGLGQRRPDGVGHEAGVQPLLGQAHADGAQGTAVQPHQDPQLLVAAAEVRASGARRPPSGRPSSTSMSRTGRRAGLRHRRRRMAGHPPVGPSRGRRRPERAGRTSGPAGPPATPWCGGSSWAPAIGAPVPRSRRVDLVAGGRGAARSGGTAASGCRPGD